MHTTAPETRLASDTQTEEQPEDRQKRERRGRDRSEENPGPPRSNRLSALILFAVVALAPLPFGSTDPATIAFWCIVLGVGMIVLTPRALNGRQFVLLGLAGVIIVAYGFVLHEQLSAHPWIASFHPLWKEASQALGTELAPSVSIARNQPFFALGPSLAAMMALILGFVVCADRARARQLLRVIAWSGAAYAAFGILSFLVDPTKLLWREKEAYTNVLTGTFINRNTAAAYFGSCAVIWLLILSEQVRRQLPRGPIKWKSVPNRLFSDMPRAIIVAFSMLFLCLAAMFMTGSRAGVLLSLMAIVLTFTLFFRRDLPPKGGIITAVIAASGIALFLLQIMGAGVGNRFDTQAFADGGRLATWRSTLRLIADHPWFGTGLGTFPWAYPSYRSADISMWGVWDRAHNTLLEIAAEMGIPLAGLITVGWLVVFVLLVQGALTRRRAHIVPIAALGVAGIAVLHSLVDFSLQIPGFALVALALTGAGLAQATRDSEHAQG
jgi:O-antigen ligase